MLKRVSLVVVVVVFSLVMTIGLRLANAGWRYGAHRDICAQSNEHQEVKRIVDSQPSGPVVATEGKYGDKILYFETKAPPSDAFK